MKIKTVFEISLKTNGDERGFLTSVEELHHIPIEIKRIFYMHHVTKDRGGHAHMDTDQVIIPISGVFCIKVFDGLHEDVYVMNDCTKGLFTPRLTFCELYNFSQNAVCLVLANTHYDISKSLRTREEFLNYITGIKTQR